MTVIFELLLGRPGEEHQVPWILNRQRSEHHGINDTENGGIGANAESKNQDGRNGKSGRPLQLAECETNVLQETLKWRPSPGFAGLFSNQCRVAESTPGRISSLFR